MPLRDSASPSQEQVLGELYRIDVRRSAPQTSKAAPATVEESCLPIAVLGLADDPEQSALRRPSLREAVSSRFLRATLSRAIQSQAARHQRVDVLQIGPSMSETGKQRAGSLYRSEGGRIRTATDRRCWCSHSLRKHASMS